MSTEDFLPGDRVKLTLLGKQQKICARALKKSVDGDVYGTVFHRSVDPDFVYVHPDGYAKLEAPSQSRYGASYWEKVEPGESKGSE